MDCSTWGFPVHHQIPELAQVLVHQVGDAIQPSHPLLSPSPVFNLSQHWGLFQMSQFFASGGQSIGASASASVLPMNIQGWFPLRLTGWISLQSKGTRESLLQHHSWKASVLRHLALFMVRLSQPYMTPGKNVALTIRIFANKGPISQSYGFSSSYVWMWDLDHKEGWVLTNWCFQTVFLEKMLENPLDSKKLKPVNPKGNQPWIFIGRTDAEAKAPMLWSPDAKSWHIGKDSDAGKDWGQEKGAREDEMFGWHHQLNG